jgi:hypothetical protein
MNLYSSINLTPQEFNYELSTILSQKNTTNTMIPSNTQLDDILEKQWNLNRLPFMDWYNIMNDTRYMNSNKGIPILFKMLYHYNSIYNYSMIRGDSIVDTMVRNGITTLQLIDGHGRMVFSVLDALISRNLNLDDYTIEVYEKDHIAYEWHKQFLPAGVKNIKMDILKLEYCPEKLIYLNFCSIPNNNLQKVLNFIEKKQYNGLYLTYSTRNVRPYTKKGQYYDIFETMNDSNILSIPGHMKTIQFT